MSRLGPTGGRAFLLLPGALTLFLGFEAGGFFAGAPALAAAVLALVLLGRLLLLERPFEGLGLPFALAAGALALYAVWTLVSQAWSHAPGRAVVEFDRALVYLLALVVFGGARRQADRLAWMARGVAAAMVVLSVAGLATRTLPDVFAVAPNLAENRLSYPLTYWNALGLVAALGLVLCFWLTTSERESRVARVLGAAAMPALAATLLFTFSRGSIAVAAVGLMVYAVVARPRGLLSGALAAGPFVAVAVVSAYGANLLAGRAPTAPAAAVQGHGVAAVVTASVAGAAVVRFGLLWLDRRLERLRLPARLRLRRRGVRWVAGATPVAVAAVALIALGAPGAVERQYHRFLSGTTVHHPGNNRARLTDPGNNGRLDLWHVALQGFKTLPVHGHGAGTFATLWDRSRPVRAQAVDAHSLYLETLEELGVVGMVALALALVAILGAFAWRARGPDRALYGALLAVGLMWALEAAVDWDWEMPAVTVWLFALGGAALATARPVGRRGQELPRLARVIVGVGLLVLAVTPVRVALSQAWLTQGQRAFHAGDCPRAIDRSLTSIDVLAVRPEAYEVIGYCDARSGAANLGVPAMERAVSLDPADWEPRYGLALVRGAAGLDPRPAARAALRLDPLEPLARHAARAFERTDDPRTWRRRALSARLP